MLCFFVLCCVVLYCVVLCCVPLHYVISDVIYYIMLSDVMLCYVIQFKLELIGSRGTVSNCPLM